MTSITYGYHENHLVRVIDAEAKRRVDSLTGLIVTQR